jgi:ribosomal protein L32
MTKLYYCGRCTHVAPLERFKIPELTFDPLERKYLYQCPNCGRKGRPMTAYRCPVCGFYGRRLDFDLARFRSRPVCPRCNVVAERMMSTPSAAVSRG